jgi:hypothetical protein
VIVPYASSLDDIAATAWDVFVLFLIVFGLAAAAFIVCVMVFWLTGRITQRALQEIREVIHRERATGVPALFTLIGAAGAAATQVVVGTLAGAGLAIGVAVITFASATLAEDGSGRLARGLGIAGCVLPFLVFTVACFASGKYGDLGPADQAIVIGCLLVGWLGVLWALVAHAREAAPAAKVPLTAST